MSDYGITSENLMQSLPAVLQSDPHMAALAQSIADVLAERPKEIQRVLIYPRIDQLEEGLLDLLAYDFKVDWYDYDYSLEAKRALIKGSFFVHRRMGTRRSVEDALSAIYPGTTVEEWFEYDGNPYYFRVILDVTSPREVIDNDKILRSINLYKPLRAHLEDNAIIYRSRSTAVVKSSCGYAIYSARRCGTYPQTSTRGGVARGAVLVETAERQAVHTAPITGAATAGTWPQVATRGGAWQGEMIVETAMVQTAYTAPATGESTTGTWPQASTRGEVAGGGLTFDGTTGAAGVYARPCGRPPGTL